MSTKTGKGNPTLGVEAVRLTLSKVITLCIALITTMLLSRFRTTEEYGTYSQLLLVINLITTLIILGLPNSINFFLARAESEKERRNFLSVYYTLCTILSIIIGAVLVLSIPLIESYFNNNAISKFYYFLALYPWASIISSSIENILVIYKKTKFLVAYRVVHSAAMLLAVLVAQLLGYGFEKYMIIFVSINCVFGISVYIICSKLCGGLQIRLDNQLIKAVFAFSIPMGLASVVGTLNTEMDKLLIGYLMDTEQMAIYTNAARELPVTIVASSITAVLLPQLTRMVKKGKTKKAVVLWGCATELALIVISLIVAGIFTYAEDAMTLLYSSKYLPGVSVFRVYTLNLILRCTYFGIILNAYGKTKQIFYCSLISLGLNAVLNPLFYWLFGMIGPAIATFISILIVLLLQLLMTARLMEISFLDVFPWENVGKILGMNIIFSIVFFFIKKYLPLDIFIGSIAETLVLGTIWSTIYILIVKSRMKSLWNRLNNIGV